MQYSTVRVRWKAPENCEDEALGRLFFAFPGGLPGIALLLLRLVLGLSVILQGRLYLNEQNASVPAWLLGLSCMAAGGLLVIGFLTPVSGLLVTAMAGAVVFAWMPSSRANVFDSATTLVFGLTLLVAVIGLGPGAYSLDARVFGRREIIIPLR